MKRFWLRGELILTAFLVILLIPGLFFLRESVLSLYLAVFGILAASATVIYQTVRNSNLVSLSVELLKRGALGDYQVLEKAMNIANGLAEELTLMKKTNQTDRKVVLNKLREILEQNKEFIGVCTCWEPDAFDGKDDAFFKTEHHEKTGRFIPYYYRGNGEIKLMQLVTLEEDDYYRLPKKTGRTTITDPYYFDLEDGRKVLLATASVPIKINGKFVGMVGVDLELKDIKEIQRDVVMFESRYKSMDVESIKNALINRKDEFVVLERLLMPQMSIRKRF